MGHRLNIREKSIEHYQHGSYFRWRMWYGNIAAVVVDIILGLLLLTGRPIWVDAIVNVVGNEQYSIASYTALLSFLVAGSFVGARAVYKSRSYQKTHLDHLHNLAHNLRLVTQCESVLKATVTDRTSLTNYCSRVCEHSANVFRALHNNSEIGCSIRLSDPDEDGHYKTVGRSANFDEGRASTSESIGSGHVIYRMLVSDEVNVDGVLVIPDIDKAGLTGFNYVEYKYEIQSMAVARLNMSLDNGHGGLDEHLMGILYFTSPKKKEFSKGDVDTVKLISDMIAGALNQVVIENRRQDGFEKESREKQNEGACQTLKSVSPRNYSRNNGSKRKGSR